MAQTRIRILGKLYTDQRAAVHSNSGSYTRGSNLVIRCFGCNVRKLCVVVRGEPKCRSCRERA